MRGVFLSLRATNSRENEAMQKKNYLIKTIFISITVLLAIISSCLSYRSLVKNDKIEPDSAFSICLWIIRILQTLLDLYICYEFSVLFQIFVKLRKAKLHSHGRSFTCRNVMVILWICVLIFLTAFTVIVRNIVGTLSIYEEDSKSEVVEIYE